MSAVEESVVKRAMLQLKPGDVVNFNSNPKWYEFWLWIVYGQIRNYQRRDHPNSDRTDDIHSVLFLGDNRFLSTQSPRTVIWPTLEVESRTKGIRVCRYLSETHTFDKDSIDFFQRTAEDVVGTPYDYGQLADILVKQLGSGFVPQEARIFDFGKDQRVCSVMAHWVLVKWWKEYGEKDGLPRPLGLSWIENTSPADFCNHPTFKVVWEWKR